MSAYDEHDDDAFDWRDAGPEERVPTADCTSCPVGFLRDLSREAQPEVTLHLLAAARELLLAMETVVRAAESTVQRNADRSDPGAAGSAPSPAARVRRIDIA
jgi:hypothetical protein